MIYSSQSGSLVPEVGSGSVIGAWMVAQVLVQSGLVMNLLSWYPIRLFEVPKHSGTCHNIRGCVKLLGRPSNADLIVFLLVLLIGFTNFDI